MKNSIYIIGSSNTDMVIKSERLPAPGETVLGGTFLMNAGGKGANQAVAAARLGGDVTLVARVGNDLFGTQSIEQFKKENINTRFISIDKNHPSGIALINVDAKGENCITVAPGANGQIFPQTLDSFFKELKSPAFVLVQLEIPLATVEYIIEECSKRNVSVILNPAPATIISESSLRKLFAITPNETESQLLSGIQIYDDESAKKAAIVLHQKGVQKVIITLGKRGAFWLDGKKSGIVTSPTVTAVDTTAAGDCFNGALAVALAEGKSLEEGVAFACLAASISVTRMGAQASMPFRKDLKVP
jgi:ribokinase